MERSQSEGTNVADAPNDGGRTQSQAPLAWSPQAQKAFIDGIMHTSQEIVLVLDPSGRISRLNTFTEDLTGFKLQDVRGQNWLNVFISDDEKKDVAAFINATIHAQRTAGNMSSFLTKDRAPRRVLWYTSALRDSRGDLTGILAVGRDITVQSMIEDRLRQSEKMEAIGRMAGGVAHDFNNMLTGIIGYTDLALSDLPQDGTLATNLGNVLKAADRARLLTRQLLSFFQTSTDANRPILLKPIIKEVLGLLSTSCGPGLKLVMNIKDEKRFIRTDPTKVHEVLMTLCDNSVRSMNGPGTLTVSLEEREVLKEAGGRVGEITPGHYSVVSISDTGDGMTPDAERRIFEPFFGVAADDQGRARVSMAVVFGVVQSLGGNIQVESVPGEGTTFRVFFPKRRSSRVDERRPERPIPRGSERILFVDAEDIVSNLAKDLLGPLGYQVQTCGEGTCALETVRATPTDFDLIVVDNGIQEMSGLTLVKRIRSIRDDVPILLSTGSAAHLDKEAMREAGVTELLVKPFSRRQLGELIRAVIDQIEPAPDLQ